MEWQFGEFVEFSESDKINDALVEINLRSCI